MAEIERDGQTAGLVDAARRSVADLTPGQRWTTSLMVALSVVILAFGMPNPIRLVSPRAPAGASATTADTPDPAEPVSPVPGIDTGFSASPLPAQPSRSAAPAPSSATPPTAPPSGGAIEPAATPGPVRLAVLVEPSSGTDLSRSNEAMARRYLEVAGVEATVVTIGDAAATCAAAGAATLAATIGTVAPALSACLRAQGTVIVAWDDATATGPPVGVISTRRGVVRSLLDTSARLASEFAGRTALVAEERYRTVLEPALRLPAVAKLGIDEVIWIAGDPGPDVAVSIAGAATENILFATSTARQSALASQVRAFLPGVAFFALDARDSVVEQRLSPALDGLRAVTSVQFPWLPAAEGVRAGCRDQWESVQVPPAVLNQGELLRALLWCQQVGLLAAVGPAPADVSAAVLALTAPSPVTSRLGPLADGGYGPTELATATWSASCSCWAADGPFRGAN